MTNLQIQKLRMYIALSILLKENPAILAKLPNGTKLLTALDNAIADIQANNLRQQESDAILREQLEELHKNLVNNIIATSRKMQAFADSKKSNALLKDIKFTKTDLANISDIELVQIAKKLHETVNLYLAELEKYELDAETQKTLLADITVYETTTPKLDKWLRDQKEITNILRVNFKTADEIVASIDKQVEIVHDSEPEFYKKYKTTRKIDVPVDVVQLVAKITDAERGTGVPNATVAFTLNDSTAEPIVKQTAEKGGFQIKTIASGIYTVTVVKLGYITQTFTITLPGDEPYSLNVKLVKG
jgi:hypothetical protein